MFQLLCIVLGISIISSLPAEAQEINNTLQLKEKIEIKTVVDEVLEVDAIEFNNSIVVDPMPVVKCSDGTTVEIKECLHEIRHRRKNKFLNFLAPGKREWAYDTVEGRVVRSKKEIQLVMDRRTIEQKHPRYMFLVRAIMATIAAGTLAF